ICYDFFFVTGMIYVDKKATADIRHQAQGFLVLVTQGLGMFIGAKAFFAFVLMMTDAETGELAWRNVWLYPCIFAAVIMVAFVVFFWDKPSAAAADDAPAGTPNEPLA
ncbi:MAG: MFS transporter, partial [Phycisphaerales bacterium JB038]